MQKPHAQEPVILSFEEAAREVEAESFHSKPAFKATISEVAKEDLPPKVSLTAEFQSPGSSVSSGWEVIEVSDESEDEVTEVKEAMTGEPLGSQRWVEEMNEINKKMMEGDTKTT